MKRLRTKNSQHVLHLEVLVDLARESAYLMGLKERVTVSDIQRTLGIRGHRLTKYLARRVKARLRFGL